MKRCPARSGRRVSHEFWPLRARPRRRVKLRRGYHGSGRTWSAASPDKLPAIEALDSARLPETRSAEMSSSANIDKRCSSRTAAYVIRNCGSRCCQLVDAAACIRPVASTVPICVSLHPHGHDDIAGMARTRPSLAPPPRPRGAAVESSGRIALPRMLVSSATAPRDIGKTRSRGGRRRPAPSARVLGGGGVKAQIGGQIVDGTARRDAAAAASATTGITLPSTLPWAEIDLLLPRDTVAAGLAAKGLARAEADQTPEAVRVC